MAIDSVRHRDRSDRLAASRRLAGAAVAGSLLFAGVMIFHAAFCAGRPAEPPRAVLAALQWSTLTLVPSGRPERVPAMSTGGIDLRFDPALDLPQTDPASLLRKGIGP